MEEVEVCDSLLQVGEANSENDTAHGNAEGGNGGPRIGGWGFSI